MKSTLVGGMCGLLMWLCSLWFAQDGLEVFILYKVCSSPLILFGMEYSFYGMIPMWMVAGFLASKSKQREIRWLLWGFLAVHYFGAVYCVFENRTYLGHDIGIYWGAHKHWRIGFLCRSIVLLNIIAYILCQVYLLNIALRKFKN